MHDLSMFPVNKIEEVFFDVIRSYKKFSSFENKGEDLVFFCNPNVNLVINRRIA